MRAVLCNSIVYRQSPEERQQDENKRSDGGERAGGEEGYAGLIAESGEIIDARSSTSPATTGVVCEVPADRETDAYFFAAV